MRCLYAAATSTVIAVLASAVPALAEEGAGGVYKCTDEFGAVTYSTSRCKGAKREFLSKEKLEGKISTIEFPKPATSDQNTSAGSLKPPAESAAASITPSATPAAANPKIRTLPIERKLKKE